MGFCSTLGAGFVGYQVKNRGVWGFTKHYVLGWDSEQDKGIATDPNESSGWFDGLKPKRYEKTGNGEWKEKGAPDPPPVNYLDEDEKRKNENGGKEVWPKRGQAMKDAKANERPSINSPSVSFEEALARVSEESDFRKMKIAVAKAMPNRTMSKGLYYLAHDLADSPSILFYNHPRYTDEGLSGLTTYDDMCNLYNVLNHTKYTREEFSGALEQRLTSAQWVSEIPDGARFNLSYLY